MISNAPSDWQKRAERHLKADGKAIHDDTLALYRVAQDVYNAASALTERGRESPGSRELIRMVWSENGDELGVKADWLARAIEARVKDWL